MHDPPPKFSLEWPLKPVDTSAWLPFPFNFWDGPLLAGIFSDDPPETTAPLPIKYEWSLISINHAIYCWSRLLTLPTYSATKFMVPRCFLSATDFRSMILETFSACFCSLSFLAKKNVVGTLKRRTIGLLCRVKFTPKANETTVWHSHWAFK